MGVSQARAFATAAASTAQGPDLDRLVLEHAALVKRIAYHLAGRLPAAVQPADLIQAGMIGLIEAARHYDATQGASFETYAGIRIRGAMLDEVRKADWVPRSVHRHAREVASAVRRIEGVKLAPPSEAEIAAEMGISLGDYHAMMQDMAGARLLSLDESDDDDSPTRGQMIRDDKAIGNPEAKCLADDLRSQISGAIHELPEREQTVLSLYYEEELNLREIGAVLGVTESRVCQIHAQALVRLRAHMKSRDGTPDKD